MKDLCQSCRSLAVNATALIFILVALTACKHTEPQANFASIAPAASVAPEEKLQAVSLPKKFDASWLKPPQDLFTLGPGDHLEIEVMGDPASRTLTVVGPDGKIYFSLLSGLDVWGATLGQTKAMLENELAKYMRDKPQVSIVLRGVESKRIWVMGRVQAPGVYAMTTPMTLLEALSMAGGTLSLANYQDQEAAGVGEELADLNRSFVIRQGKLLPINFPGLLRNGDMSQNIYLQPDDFVYLPATTAREVYVLGAVAQPRAVLWKEGLTVAQAVASAYGTIKGAYMHHVAVVRGPLTDPQMAVVDYRRVINGQATDIALQPHDIVYVPFSPYRYIDKYLELVLNTFVSAAAINAGSQVVNKRGVGATGVFIPFNSGISITPPVNPPPIH